MTSNQFAYGGDVVEDDQGNSCECPATSAGFNTMQPAMSKVAGRYDENMYDEEEYRGRHTGVVSEEEAKEAWLEVVSHFESQDRNMPYEDAAKEVAQKLGWLE